LCCSGVCDWHCCLLLPTLYYRHLICCSWSGMPVLVLEKYNFEKEF
jgi:hypothetical protein